ncbi:hypothetical protein NIES2111_67770 (plasmid) [Nostoc sp. NIES-2111]|nr:hypothetical protein NIES2111_67770 [Nostoc sp. NIES-2111]
MHGFGWEGWNSNVPLDPNIGTRCKVMLHKGLKTLDFTLFRYRIERVLSCENITKKGH